MALRVPRTRSLLLGDEYHHRFFWLEATRLFIDSRNVASVAIELAEARAFDDVVAKYRVPIPDSFGKPVHQDHFQLKFHLTGRSEIRGHDLIDPEFIGASAVSLLQRALEAVRLGAVPRRRLFLVTPWCIRNGDPLYGLVSNRSGEILVDRVLRARPRSDIGTLREDWRRALGDVDEGELVKVLEAIHFYPPKRLDELDRDLDQRLRLAGLAPVDDILVQHPYEAISRRFIVDGTLEHDRSSLDDVLVRERLRLRQPWTADVGRRVLGIKSFERFSFQLEDGAESISLLPFFHGRAKAEEVDWDRDIAGALTKFLGRVQSGQQYEIRLDCHLSIAYVAGLSLGKVAADVYPSRGAESWRPDGAPVVGEWSVREVTVGEGPELAVGISVTREVENDVRAFLREHVPAVGRLVTLTIADGVGDRSVRGGDHARALAARAGRLIQSARNDRDRGRPLHMFMAGPAPLAFLLGREGRAFGPTTTYEFAFESGVPGAYAEAFHIGARDGRVNK